MQICIKCSLAPFNVEPVTEWMEQERQKKEYEERKQQQETRDKARAEEQQRQQAATQAAILESKNAMRQKDRQTSQAVNKFKIIKPGAAGVPGGAAPAPPSVANAGATSGGMANGRSSTMEAPPGAGGQEDPANKKPRI